MGGQVYGIMIMVKDMQTIVSDSAFGTCSEPLS